MKPIKYISTILLLLVTLNANAQFVTGQPAASVLGQTNFTGSLTNQVGNGKFNAPSKIAVGPDGKFYISDQSNHRVLRYASAAAATSGAPAEAVFGQPNFTSGAPGVGRNRLNRPVGLAFEGDNLYVADAGNNRVLRFDNAGSKLSGANADVVFGQSSFTSNFGSNSRNGMRFPSGVAYSSSNDVLYVADNNNNRVLIFYNVSSITSGSTDIPADAVLGQPDFDSSNEDQMKSPEDVVLVNAPGSEVLFVADSRNNRVLRFNDANNASSGDLPSDVLGQPNLTSTTARTTANGMDFPIGFAYDGSTTLFVMDVRNNRVLRFDNVLDKTAGDDADGVLGQPDFTSKAFSFFVATQRTFRDPLGGIVIAGDLYVADQNFNRVLRFNNAASKANGDNADAVIGQSDFISRAPNIINNITMELPNELAINPTTGKVFVCDDASNRVLRFSSVNSLLIGGAAEAVLGQLNFSSSSVAVTSLFMNSPSALAIDAVDNLYVADRDNNRVLRFASASTIASGTPAASVLGQATFTDSARGTARDKMDLPRGVAIDATGNLYVADSFNNRVLKFTNAASKLNGANADTVLGQVNFVSKVEAATQSGMFSPQGLSVDNAANLYVADTRNNRVLIFLNAATKASGANADKVLGQPNFTTGAAATPSQLTCGLPNDMIVSTDGTLYVPCSSERRVMVFRNVLSKPNGAPADVVLGKPDFTTTNNSLSQNGMGQCFGVALDASGNLFVADRENKRVLRYAPNATFTPLPWFNGQNANLVLGQPDFTTAVATSGATGMSSSWDVAIDAPRNKIYVADAFNNRVLRFSTVGLTNGAVAEAVFGQPDFATTTPGTSAAKMDVVYAVVVDASGNLFVSDKNNHRILRFNAAHTKPSGANADGVLGQPDFTSNSFDTGQNRLSSPEGITLDAAGNLYVADVFNHRILRFNNAASKSNGANADGVLGQADFVSNTAALLQNRLDRPTDVALDNSGNLYVVDLSNNRVLRFNNAIAKLNGANADAVFGQSNFTTLSSFASQSQFVAPQSVALDALGNLYVSSISEGRILIFNNAIAKPNGANADAVLGQADFTSSFGGTAANKLSGCRGMAINSATGELYIADTFNHRVLRFGSFAPLPVELSSFTVRQDNGRVALNWTTASEKNNAGFEIQRTDNGNWKVLGFIKGNGTTTQSQSYSFIDRTASGKVQYRLKQIDFDGQFEVLPTVEVEVGTPRTFALDQNYPNPFNPTTTINYQLPVSGQVSLKVYDLLGREVATLVNQRQDAGRYQMNFNAASLSSGVYFYRLQAGTYVQTNKMMLVK